MMKRSFTLIEILLVIALIAILAGIAIPNIEQNYMRTRDAERLADMEALKMGIEAFYQDWGYYPDHVSDPDYVGDEVGGGAVGVGECVGDYDYVNNVGIPHGVCNGARGFEEAMRRYMHGNVPSDPIYGAQGDNFYYAYDPLQTVDWCDGDATNDTTAPVLGFRRAETDRVRNLDRKDTCSSVGGGGLGLDVSEYNTALLAP